MLFVRMELFAAPTPPQSPFAPRGGGRHWSSKQRGRIEREREREREREEKTKKGEKEGEGAKRWREEND